MLVWAACKLGRVLIGLRAWLGTGQSRARLGWVTRNTVPLVWFEGDQWCWANSWQIVGVGKMEKRESEKKKREKGKRKEEKEEKRKKKCFWVVRVFETRIYTVFYFLEKSCFLRILSHDFRFLINTAKK